MRARIAMLAWVAAIAASTAEAQSLSEKVRAAPTDGIRMTYAAREDLCANEVGFRFNGRSDVNWVNRCESGPVRLQIEKDGDRITRIRMYTGGSWRPRAEVSDLGVVSAAEASEWLLEVATTAAERAAEDAIVAAVVADAPDPWPQLLELARDGSRSEGVRKSALFWVGQSAARDATRELAAILDSESENTEIQKAAVFALSQRDEPERVDHLITVARTHPNPEVVRIAFFWLADSTDERAMSFFEEVLIAQDP